ncbi:Non-functional pseudokinase ZED1 [Camellia lanceoleosa]|uniref:Non-functional pseudokinase ZED1 n=1 Tax=Camellia lanceoleosa TaxID=1840588 RepID=A0ACC0FPA6_9ERIC|nr:Non-functional pseudokinase ZED1 [Camellia lanceoleosa]
MGCGSKILRLIWNKNTKNINDDDKYYNFCSEQERKFLENGSMLLEELIAFSNGRYNIPIRRFSVHELSQATNRFCFSNQIVSRLCSSRIYKGLLEERLIFVKKYDEPNGHPHSNEVKSFAIRDLVVTTLMSSHKNVLKLIGCCLDFEFPASVYECTGSIESLANRLYERKGDMMENNGLLMWKSRLKIAYDIAYAVVYMHTAFSTPIIHRDLTPDHIIIDQFGIAKLIDFSLSIPIPPGKKQVEDLVMGTYGYADPEYMHTSVLTEKSDVYGFGMILLELLTGERAYDNKRGKNRELLNNCVEDYVDNDQFNKLVDPRILEGGGTVQEQQFQAVIALALRCTQENREDRPEMIDVAKELRQIHKSVSNSLPQQ